MKERGGERQKRNDAKQNECRAGRQKFVERVSRVDRRISHHRTGGGQDARNVRGGQARNACKPFSSARPFADRNQGGGEQRAERDAHARADQSLLDRVTHQKDAAEGKCNAADPNHPAGAEPLFKADRSRRRRRGRRGADGRHRRGRRWRQRRRSSGRSRSARGNLRGFGCRCGRCFGLRRRCGRGRRCQRLWRGSSWRRPLWQQPWCTRELERAQPLVEATNGAELRERNHECGNGNHRNRQCGKQQHVEEVVHRSPHCADRGP